MNSLSTYIGYSDRYGATCQYYYIGDLVTRGYNMTKKRTGFLSRRAQAESIVVIKDPLP